MGQNITSDLIMDEQKTYQIFDDGSAEKFTVKKTTNENIRNVCRVYSQAAFKGDDERLYYTEQGDIPADRIDEEGTPIYDLPSIYMPGKFWPAVAQQLFYGVDDIVVVKDGVAQIVDSGRYEKLDRGVVKKAADDFFLNGGVIPFEVKNSLSWLSSDRMKEITSLLAARKEVTQPMEEMSESGKASSSGDMGTGQA